MADCFSCQPLIESRFPRPTDLLQRHRVGPLGGQAGSYALSHFDLRAVRNYSALRVGNRVYFGLIWPQLGLWNMGDEKTDAGDSGH